MKNKNDIQKHERVKLKGEFIAAGAGIGLMLGAFLGGPISIIGLSAIGWIIGSIVEGRCEIALNTLDGKENRGLIEHKPSP